MSQRSNLDRLLAERERAAQQLRRDSVAFSNLLAEVRKKRETLDALIARQSEIALATRLKDLDATSSNVRVVDKARPPEAPFRPDRTLNVLLGVLLGAGLGVAFAFFLDYLDNTVNGVAEIEPLTGLPVLAAIPTLGAPARPVAHAPKRETARRFGTVKFPETWFLGPTGEVLGHVAGPMDWSSPQTRAQISSLILTITRHSYTIPSSSRIFRNPCIRCRCDRRKIRIVNVTFNISILFVKLFEILND